MEHIDRVSHRVAISTGLGVFLGAAVSTYRGTPNLPRTSLAAGAACAMAATACLGAERLFNISLSRWGSPEFFAKDDTRRLYASHAAGGMVGGAVAGGAMRQRPLPGAVVFVPIMLLVAWTEVAVEEYREERIRDLASTSTSATTASATVVGAEDREKNGEH